MQKLFLWMTGVFFLTLVIGFSNPSKVQNIRNYYFPCKQFMEPKIYCYKVSGSGMDDKRIAYWYLRTIVKDSDTIFYACIFDEEFMILDSMIERIGKNGSELIGYALFGERIPIIKKDVFKWKQSLDEPIFYTIKFGQEGYGYTMEKKRVLTKTGLELNYENKSYKAIEMTDYFTNQYDNGQPPNISSRKCKYALGFGLVEFTSGQEGNNDIYALEKVYSEVEWNVLIKQ